jgi:hypothetical protein
MSLNQQKTQFDEFLNQASEHLKNPRYYLCLLAHILRCISDDVSTVADELPPSDGQKE